MSDRRGLPGSRVEANRAGITATTSALSRCTLRDRRGSIRSCQLLGRLAGKHGKHTDDFKEESQLLSDRGESVKGNSNEVPFAGKHQMRNGLILQGMTIEHSLYGLDGLDRFKAARKQEIAVSYKIGFRIHPIQGSS